jgi:polar amino acid transport system substrate-binding protein
MTLSISRWLLAALVTAGLASLVQTAQAETITTCAADAFAKKYPSLVGREIRIAQDGQSSPYSFRDPADFNTIAGVDADVARAALTCIGLKSSFTIGSWSGLLPAVLADQSDIMWDGLSYTAARAEQVNYVLYMHAASAGMVHKGNPKGISSLASLCGLRAAAGLATTEAALLADQDKKCAAAGKAAIELVTYPDVPSAARLIENDRADVVVTDLGVVADLARAKPDVFERGFTLASEVTTGPGFRKDDLDLAKAVAEAMAIIYANGTLKGIIVKYGFDPALMMVPKLVTN